VKHAEFQRMVKGGRPGNEEDASQFQEVIPNPDYVMCEHCDRRFNELAAERHIPICKESKRKAEMRGGSVKSGGKAGSGGGAERKKRMNYDPRKASMSPKK
jgi:hypothetical protein